MTYLEHLIGKLSRRKDLDQARATMLLKETITQSGLKDQGEARVTKPTVEKAIEAWENDVECNKEGYKIARGKDGKQVEVVLVDGSERAVFAFLVNGNREEPFQIGGEMQSMDQALGNLTFRQFLNEDVFQCWYEIKGIKRFDAQVNENNQGFVFGLPGEEPDELPTNFRAM